MRSVSRRLVDFSEADLFDKNWHLYVNAMAGVAAEQDRLQALDVIIAMQSRQLTAMAGSEDRQAVQDAADRLTGHWTDYLHTLYPWLQDGPVDATAQALALYKQVMGDPSSAEFKQKMAEFVERLNRHKQEAMAKPRPPSYDGVPEWLLRDVEQARARAN